MEETNTYLRAAYTDTTMATVVEREGFSSFQEMAAKFSVEGLSLQQMADRLGLVVQRFTAYHSLWMRQNAAPLDLEDV